MKATLTLRLATMCSADILKMVSCQVSSSLITTFILSLGCQANCTKFTWLLLAKLRSYSKFYVWWWQRSTWVWTSRVETSWMECGGYPTTSGNLTSPSISVSASSLIVMLDTIDRLLLISSVVLMLQDPTTLFHCQGLREATHPARLSIAFSTL